MKKKANDIRAAREQAKQQNAQKFKNDAAKRNQEEEEKRIKDAEEVAAKKEAALLARIKAEHPEITDKRIKSSAKAAGLKSTFMVGKDKLLMTSFGKGNEAVPEKRVQGAEITDVNFPGMFTLERSTDAKASGFVISGRVDAYTDDPLNSRKKPGDDLIHNRVQLERRYFGTTFPDNIHIQLIYNILDIDKILTEHINNIVYTVNNLFRKEEEDNHDIIGQLFGLNEMSFEKFEETLNAEHNGKARSIDRFLNSPYLGYFGNTVYNKQLIDAANENKVNAAALRSYRKRNYYLLLLLSMTRQSLAHNNAYLFTLEPECDCADTPSNMAAARKALNDIFDDKVDKLNREFLSTSAKNLRILFKILRCVSEADKTRVARDYYDFSVRKTYKNMGFSMKTLREEMLALKDVPDMRSMEYDSVRSKMYNLLDFIIYERYLGSEKAAGEKLVNELRAAPNDFDKRLCYAHEADRLWQIIRSDVENELLPKMNGDYIKTLDNAVPELDEKAFADVLMKPSVSYFSKLMYLLTTFIDGKEINDLLTTLLSKFENIQSFLTVLESCGHPAKFKPEYQLLLRSGEIADELRFINSFARMTGKEKRKPPQKKDANAPRVVSFTEKSMYIDAATVLGYNKGKEELISKLDDASSGDKDKKDGGFSSFLLNNVLPSRRFAYLMRYSNAANVRRLAENKHIVSFVLGQIPDAQITRYYESVTGGEACGIETMRGELVRLLTGLSFEEFAYIGKGLDKAGYRLALERKKSLVGLYFTVLYLLTKNLVYVNSRYFLAFHCAERDAQIFDGLKYTEDFIKNDRAAFARDFLNQYPGKKRVKAYLDVNMANSDPWAIRQFRNTTEHLNAVREAYKHAQSIGAFKSYFELYHYLVQCDILEQYTESPTNLHGKTAAYFDLIQKHHTYSKDFVKALCVPFAYNLPRFKNLSIEGLFDMNRPGEDTMPEKIREMGEQA